MNETIRAGIVGGAGYTAGELVRLLLNHPAVEIAFVNSESNAGNLLTDVHAGLYGETDLRFTDALPFDTVDVVFFCFGHGKSTQFLSEHYIPADVKIIDLAQDFRLAAEDNDYVYGLPELNRERISGAFHVANPGCFATCIQLGLLPLAKAGLLADDVSVNAITGATGAGVKPSATTHFAWRSGNVSIYKPFRHQHVPEILQSLRQLQPGFGGSIDFIPYRGDFARGIFATSVVRAAIAQEELDDTFRDFYSEAPFTHYTEKPLDMKQVSGTNKCLVHAESIDGKILVTSVIDNLLKGASGQAVQNMNLMFGLEETAGLHLKPTAF
ncbi:MAG: N-acetyl-gamma-glutamyl-phosphate reductase [Alloprevotella sp.]